jgi:hypothetical protein
LTGISVEEVTGEGGGDEVPAPAVDQVHEQLNSQHCLFIYDE